jgi:phage terminase large subunit
MSDNIIQMDFVPRAYQLPLLRALDSGVRRACVLWHRRCGKDLTLWNYMIVDAMRKPGIYYYFLPTYAQGKKIIWYGMDKDGRRFRNYIPAAALANQHETEMRIELKNDSLIQIVGTDNIDSIVGTNPRGCVFSEYALQDPKAWDYISPILMENKGWAAFPYTPRGKNHGFRLWQIAKANPKLWFSQKLSVEDTNVLTPDDIDEERANGRPEEIIQQEYYCSFNAFVSGSYFCMQLERLTREGRFCSVPWEPALPVHTAWDLGVDDATTIWFAQETRGGEMRIIDYLEETGKGLDYYARALFQKPYVYGTHLAPHDISVREWGSGKSRLETAQDLGIHFTTVKRLPKEDQINAARMLLPRCIFDEDHTLQGVRCLEEYRGKYTGTTPIGTYDAAVEMQAPVHNWASHGADAFMTLAVGADRLGDEQDVDQFALGDFNPWGKPSRDTYMGDFDPTMGDYNG